MSIVRLSSGERISGGSAILLLAFMFLQWYGISIAERPNLLFGLRIFDDGGNAWQTLGAISFVLVLVIAVTVGVLVRRLIDQDWKPTVSSGAVFFILGVLAACLILVRIVFPPDLGREIEGFTFEVTLKAGIFLSLVAACGIAYGGRRAMREEGVSFGDLHLRRRGHGLHIHGRAHRSGKQTGG